MSENDKDRGVILTLVERFESQRLPRARALKEKVDRGELLDDFDIAFLQEVFDDSHQIRGYLQRYPEWQPLAAQAMSLYKEITERALANEQARAGKR